MSILRRFTDFVLQNRAQAIGTAFVIAYLPLIGMISILIAGLVTLRKGALEGFLVLLAATAPCILSYYLFPSAEAIEFEWITLNIIVISNFLVWVFALLLRGYSNWSLVLEYGLLLGILVVGVVHILNPDIQNKWSALLTKYVTHSQVLMKEFKTDAKLQENVYKTINSAKKLATGMAVVFILFNTWQQLFIARWWQAAIFNPGGLRKELHAIRMSHVMGVLYILCFVLAYLNNETALDITPITNTVFAVAGLSLLHALFIRLKLGWLCLLLTYIACILLFPVSLLLLAALALLDVGFNFRSRLLTL